MDLMNPERRISGWKMQKGNANEKLLCIVLISSKLMPLHERSRLQVFRNIFLLLTSSYNLGHARLVGQEMKLTHVERCSKSSGC